MTGTTIPEFPTDIPIQPLTAIDYERLKNGDEREVDALWQAATSIGFWYFKNHGLERCMEKMHTMGKETMNLPLTEKLNYVRPDSSFGYKRVGDSDAQSNSTDTVEILDVAKDDVLSWSKVNQRIYPSTVNSHIDSAIAPFIKGSMEMTDTILNIFCSKLELPKGTLSKLHSAEEPSMTEARTIKIPKNLPPERHVQFGTHVFPGSLCFLHSNPSLGGVQIMPSGVDEWLWLKPIPRHVIINVGLPLSILSGGILRSPILRVIAPPGDLASYERWSQVYYVHPGDSVVLRPLTDRSPLIASAVNSLSEEDRAALTSHGGLGEHHDVLHLGTRN
ncbi:hypothetical protein GYMLUDRAFT_161107 [Collybiopsis luxurians FD-317 M1]|nr:hypothetical protein GYMLUDRAFT_161107 [Collybiopsis luxurians FD-317 M1]